MFLFLFQCICVTYQEFAVLQLQFSQIVAVCSFTHRRDLTLENEEAIRNIRNRSDKQPKQYCLV